MKEKEKNINIIVYILFIVFIVFSFILLCNNAERIDNQNEIIERGN